MHATLVYVHVKTEHINDFIKACAENHRNSINEPGNFRFDILQQNDDPSRFVLYESYANESDANQHKQTQHYLKWRTAVENWMASPRNGVLHQGLLPEVKK